MDPNCNVDLDHQCDGGEDGGLCESCKENHDYWASYFSSPVVKGAYAQEYSEQYREDMIDAGRGHLLPPR